MPTATTPEPVTRGHRKKSRTQSQLLTAALEVLAERGEAFTVADVAARAGTSHGTFYNYFTDRDALLDALVADTVEAFAARSATAVDEPDPALRFARISARALATAVESPTAVRFALRLEAAQRALLVAGPMAYLRSDLEEGHRLGRFPEYPDDATFDVVVGALLMAARRMLSGEADTHYPVAVIRRLLVALGMDGAEATGLAQLAVRDAQAG